jgi:uncharacterized membrane protein YhaH (DUF805 family)
MGFAASISSCFSNYVTFDGRAPRSEFWFFYLFAVIATSALIFTGPGVFLSIAFVLPLWAVGIRRLHDIDKSGWNILWYAIPPVALILIFVWNARRGTKGANDYGQDPLADSPSITAPSPVSNVADKAEQLTKLKVLLETGAVNQAEFEKMKAEILEG